MMLDFPLAQIDVPTAEPAAGDQSRSQIVYEFARAATLEGWWVWALVICGIAAALYFCRRFYRRDVAELSRPVRWTLVTLRLLTLVALVFFFFNLQRRTERLVTRPSEVVMLVDTSQSMSLPASSRLDATSRADRAKQIVEETDLMQRLGRQHRVSVYAFDAQSEPRLIFASTSSTSTSSNRSGQTTALDSPVGAATPVRGDRSPSGLARFGGLGVSIGLLLGLITLVMGMSGHSGSVGWLLLTSATCLTIGIACLGGVYAVRTGDSLTTILGIGGVNQPSDTVENDTATAQESSPRVTAVDWQQELAAAGGESRIGDAIRTVLADHEATTLAGIVLLTDGQNNGGSDTGTALAAARRSEVSVYPVGLGSSDPPINVRVVDLDAPKRIYPGDRFAVSAVLQASGPGPVEVDVQLLDGLDEASGGDAVADSSDLQDNLPTNVIDTQRVTLSNDGGLAGLRFELEPESVGRRRVAVRVIAPEGDTNQRDDSRDARYEVVARKLKVLAVAGGPTREYRFVRNLLHRDNSVELDVWLQTGTPGMSQDAARMLTRFPDTPEDLFDYDAIIVFDPDWSAFTAESLDLMDRWLSQQAGGLVLIAGPVFHPDWFRRRTDPRVAKVSGFFPVDLATRGALLGGGRQGGENAWPLQFTPEAQRAEFLWIAEQPAESFQIWDQFDGVYDFVGVKDLKPGAKAYALFSDPTSRTSDRLPIYLASQFYGAGRTYFQSSGEMWRLRRASDAYFDTYYTKLIRWVSEGRLLRDSNRGILLLDNSRAMVGDNIVVRAVLTDEQFEPLTVPEVPVKILTPSGKTNDLKLQPLKGEARGGTYGGRFTVREAGSYEVRLTIGDALSEQVLRQSLQVRLPTIELERPRRNDAELKQLADLTAGSYLPFGEDVSSQDVALELSGLILPQPQTTILPGTPDRDFTVRRNAVLMWLIATLLTFEWVTRRLHRLA